jgi:HlyD family secretion protein
MRRTTWIIAGAVFALGLAAIGWTTFAARVLDRTGNDEAISKSETVLLTQPKARGRIEPAGEVIDIGSVMGERLAILPVKEGESVKQDQPLAYLDSRDLRKLEVEAIEKEREEAGARENAELRLADARISAARLGVQQSEMHQADIQAEELRLPVLERSWQLAKKEQDRLKELSNRLISEQERERQELAAEKARVEYQAASKLLEKSKRSNDLAMQAAQADLEAALASREVALHSAPLESLEKKLELAKAQCDRTVLRAPCDGTVLKIFVRPGEVVGSTPILQMANLDRMMVVAQVYETDVKRIRVGQSTVVTSRSFQSPYDRQGLEGRVTRIGQIISPASMRQLDPLAPVDRRVVDVRIELGPDASRQAREYVHMQVDVTFGDELLPQQARVSEAVSVNSLGP